MRIKYKCLPCLVNQAVKVAEIAHVPDADVLLHKVFAYLSTVDFSRTNPEVIGATFRILKEHTGNADPYKEVRRYYNDMFMGMSGQFAREIDAADDAFERAVKYAITGNIIDFSPMHDTGMSDVERAFAQVAGKQLDINDCARLKSNIMSAKRLLYLGDNCGEICLDKLFIERIKALNPALEIWFGVRGVPVVNDSIAEDAYYVGMDEYAHIISNGDDSLGTVLDRVSPEFREVFDSADVIIAKGQANYESLSEECGHNMYFMLMTKCEVMAADIGVGQKEMVCLNVCR